MQVCKIPHFSLIRHTTLQAIYVYMTVKISIFILSRTTLLVLVTNFPNVIIYARHAIALKKIAKSCLWTFLQTNKKRRKIYCNSYFWTEFQSICFALPLIDFFFSILLLSTFRIFFLSLFSNLVSWIRKKKS